MKLTLNWLKKYIDLPGSISAEQIADKLKMSTVEVEGVDRQGKDLANIVIGKVVKAEKHPDADKLKLCQVDVKNEKLQIVCGGSNVREGMLVALAKIGSKVKWHGEGEPVELAPTKIRGVDSFGMICGASEIGLTEMFPPKEEREIVDLTGVVSEKSIGKPLADGLGLNDVIFEIDNKSLSNRPDLWGHYGMAREVAALFSRPLKDYGAKKIKVAKEVLALKVDIKDEKLCPRYMAVAVSGVKIDESPKWLKQNLIAAGLRPINNIVDITNYIMLDLGEPMHAFDASRIKLNTIIVRPAEKDEVLTLLDGSKIDLNPEDLVIADSEKPIALAGIMGGEFSGITEKTETIIFEAANFNAASIRRSSIRLGLRTDSSARFEKSLDPNLCEMAIKKAVELTLETCPGAEVVSAVADKGKFVVPTGPIVIEKNIFSKKLGMEIPEKQIANILEQMGFGVKIKGDKWSVTIPTWRATKDISIAEDLVEEVVRIFGYEKIISTLPEMSIAAPEVNRLRSAEHAIREILVRDFKFSEVYNYAFVSRGQVEKMHDTAEHLELHNPLSKEKPFLSRSLVPNMLENVAKNIEYFDSIKIFEIAKVFWPEKAGMRSFANGSELLPRQDTYLSVVYSEKNNNQPFATIKRVFDRLALNLGLSVSKPNKIPVWMHPGRSGEIICGSEVVGRIYELSPIIGNNFGLEEKAAILEISLDELCARSDWQAIIYKKPSEFPEVMRDLSFAIGREISHAGIVKDISSGSDLIKHIEVFDVYEGEPVPKDKKSMAYRLTFAHPERTLTADEVDAAMEKVASGLKKKFGAEIRK